MRQSDGRSIVLAEGYLPIVLGKLKQAQVEAVALLITAAVFVQNLDGNFSFCAAQLLCEGEAAGYAHHVGKLGIAHQLILIPAVRQKLVTDEQARNDGEDCLLLCRRKLLQLL